MPLKLSNRQILDRRDPIELVLELLSFAGGENTIGEDHELKSNEARIIENWDPLSLGGMIRSKGITKVADGGGSYTEDLDLLIQHEEGGSTQTYAVIEGDLVKKAAANLTQTDNNVFTSGLLCHAVSAGDKLWITNATDNLKYTTLAGSITVPADKPTNARERMYDHKFRLIAEGGSKRVYGSRAGSGNWTAADAWSLANDAWNIDMPNPTKGCVPRFLGDAFIVFTEFGAYEIYNFPDVAYRHIANSHGCSAPLSLAKGNEGIFLVSTYPTLGVWLWNGANWINLTEHHNFPSDIDFSNRIFGIYRDNEYHLFYSDGTVAYPNVHRIYNTKFGRWMKRPLNAAVSDTLGYPALLTHDNNELYAGSAQTDKLYEIEHATDSDNGESTEANYKTKDFTSADFNVASGGRFPIDEVRMKLTKITVTFYGTKGSITVQFSADRGRYSGSQTFSLQADGDLINDTFIVNTSYIITLPPDKTVVKSWKASAIGRRFNFQILNSNTGTRPEIKKIKIHAIALEEA